MESSMNKKSGAAEQRVHRPSLLINAMSNWATLGANMVVALFITPIIIRKLGLGTYGIYDLVGTIVGYSGLLDLGITSAIMRYAARYAGQRDRDGLNRVLNTSLLGFVGIGLFVFLLTIVLSGPLAHFFHINAQDTNTFRLVIILFGLSAALTFPGTVLSVFVAAHERYVLFNTVKIIAACFRGAFALTVLWSGGGLVALSWVTVIISAMILGMNLVLVLRFIDGVRFSPAYLSRSMGKELTSFGLFTFVNKIGDVLRFRMDSAVIVRFLDLKSNGLYALGGLMFKNVFKVTIACSGVTSPRLAALAGREDLTEFRNAYLRFSLVISVFACSVATLMFLVVPDFMLLWVPRPPAEVKVAITVFFILLGGMLPDVMTNVTNNALQAIRKHPFLAYQTALEGVANLILSIILVHYFGLYGVAIGSAAPALVTKIIIQPIYSTRVIGIPWSVFFVKIIARPLAVMSLTGMMIHLVGSRLFGSFIAPSYVLLAMKAALVAAVIASVAYFLCMDADFRRRMAMKLSGIPASLRMRFGLSSS